MKPRNTQQLSSHLRAQRGFTLMELMITTVVIGILTAVITIGAVGFTRTYRVRSGVRDIVGLINYARGQASTTHRLYRIWFCVKGSSCPAFGTLSAANGGVVVQQGASSAASDAFPDLRSGVSLAGLENRRYSLAVSNPAVVIDGLYLGSTTATAPLAIYFKPDGRVLRCNKGNTGVNCTPTELNICMRGDLSQGSTGPAAKRREIRLRFNGTVMVESRNPTRCR